MKKFLIIAMALSGLLAFTSPASAADPVDLTYDWSGAYIGLVGGYGFLESQHCDRPDCPSSGLGAGPHVDDDGITGGATLGYNFQLDSVVLGLEADYSFADINASSPSIAGYGCGASCETNVDSFGTLRGRLGFAMDRFMPYVTGGVAIMDVEGVLDGVGSDDTFFNGVAGLGVEYAITDNLTIKSEYLHVFDNGDVFRFDPGGCAAPGCAVKDVSLDVFRVGLNYKF